jgi:hypothetical protein
VKMLSPNGSGTAPGQLKVASIVVSMSGAVQ